MDIVFSKAICMHVTTYDSLIPKGEKIAFLLRTIMGTFSKFVKKELIIEIEKVNKRSQI
jgi:hypothetical protein